MVATVAHGFASTGVDYAAVAFAAAVSWLIVTGPGEAVLVASAIAAAHHKVDIVSVVAVAWAGASAGGMAGWLLGRSVGRRLVTAPGPLRDGRARLIALGDRLYERHGALAVIVTPSWMAGINHMRAWRFSTINAVCALAWALILGVGGFYLGPDVVDVFDDAGYAAIALVVAVVLIAALKRSRLHPRAGP